MTNQEAYNYAGLRGTQLLKRDRAYMIDSEKELEFVFQARAALEKQIPQKPATYRFPSMIKKAMCPRCLMVEDESANYCRACGQALDWGSEDENA